MGEGGDWEGEGKRREEVLDRREESVVEDAGCVVDGCGGRGGGGGDSWTGVLKAHHISSLRQTISSPRTSMPMQSPICAILTTGTGEVGDSSFTSGSFLDLGRGCVVDGAWLSEAVVDTRSAGGT